MINSEPMLGPISVTVIRLLWVVIVYPYLRRYRVQPKKDWGNGRFLLRVVVDSEQGRSMKIRRNGHERALRAGS